MRRREFIAGLGGAVAWPVVARAQQSGRMSRLIYLAQGAEGDPEQRLRLAAFRTAFEKLGWADGRNVHIDYRWGVAAPGGERVVAAELVNTAPSVILAAGSAMVEALRDLTRSVPVVFLAVSDPLNSGLVSNMARPGGECDRLCELCVFDGRKMAGAAQGGCAGD